MSAPGWYPDPAGSPGHFRYWNGASWSHETTTTPASSPAPSGTPSGPTPVPPKRGRSGLILAIVGVLVLALGIFWFLNRGTNQPAAQEDTNTSKPTVSAWNETSKPSPTPSHSESPEPSGAALTSCPSTGGSTVSLSGSKIEGGGLEADEIPGWGDGKGNFSMRWAHDTESQTSTVYTSFLGGTWFSVVSLSKVLKSDGFTGVQQAARGVMSCFASSSYYQNFSGRTDLLNEAVTISGHPGYRVRAEVHVNDSHFPNIQGDVVDVIAVNTGSTDGFGLFVSSYTIGDTSRQPLVDACIASLRVP